MSVKGILYYGETQEIFCEDEETVVTSLGLTSGPGSKFISVGLGADGEYRVAIGGEDIATGNLKKCRID